MYIKQRQRSMISIYICKITNEADIDTKNDRHYMLWTDYCLLPLIIWERLNFSYHNRWFLGFSFPDLYLFLCIERGPKMAYDFSANTQVYLKLTDS